MDSKAKRAAENFIKNLTDASTVEIQKYITEIEINREFHSHLEENRSNFGKMRYFYWVPSIGTALGTILYALCRCQKPSILVETGVASGVSSAYILCALEENEHGELYSIDLPLEATYARRYLTTNDDVSPVPREKQSGWLIPDYLRHRWHLISGRSSERLAPLLEQVREIDVFLHDSEHTYQYMLWEYETAWAHLKPRGLLLSHNIDVNHAFSDFCRGARVKGYALADIGGALKG